MKKVLCAVLAFLLTLSVAGCAAKVSSQELSKPADTASSQAESSQAEASKTEESKAESAAAESTADKAPADAESTSVNDRLEEIFKFAVDDVFNQGFSIVWNYSSAGKNQDGSVIKNIDDTLSKLKNTMNKKGEYDKYIESLQDPKYDDLKRVWKKFSSQADLMYMAANSKMITAKDQSLNFTSVEILDRDLTDFEDEANKLVQ